MRKSFDTEFMAKVALEERKIRGSLLEGLRGLS